MVSMVSELPMVGGRRGERNEEARRSVGVHACGEVEVWMDAGGGRGGRGGFGGVGGSGAIFETPH
jgi:hypothetical protein